MLFVSAAVDRCVVVHLQWDTHQEKQVLTTSYPHNLTVVHAVHVQDLFSQKQAHYQSIYDCTILKSL